jgi:hypothetical protein
LGPLLVRPGKTELERNAFGWNQKATLLVINGPPPVGFSHCDPPGPAGAFDSCGAWNDSSTAYHNRLAIEGVLAKHPRLKSLDWYFTGESYAGVYIPTLVRELLTYGPKDLKIRGMALGNACMGTDVLCFAPGDYWWKAVFLRGHAQISDASFSKFDKACGESLRRGQASEACVKMSADLDRQAGWFYEYDVFSECWYDGDFAPPIAVPEFLRGRGGRKSRVSIGGKEFCGGDAQLYKWVNLPQVRRALNVPLNAQFHDGDNGVGFRYDLTEKDLRPFYRQLAQKKSSASDKIRVLVYSGDTDVSVNVFASQNWTTKLGQKEIEAWRPWTLDGGKAVVGYVTRYENNFDFVTIRGSGHMVPVRHAFLWGFEHAALTFSRAQQFKSQAAFELLSRFLRNQPLQKFDGSKRGPSPLVVLN